VERLYGTMIKSFDEGEKDGDNKAMFSMSGNLLSWVI
jgi:hypothetical protein